MSERFQLILSDPPWRYAQWSDVKQGAASAHYDTMSLDDLSAIPVESWAADDCFLALWATFPKLDEAFKLIERWGFIYITGAPWVKTVPSSGTIRRGIGHWFQSASELLLLAKRGKPERGLRDEHMIGLLAGEQRSFYAPTFAHSQKPYGLQDWLERSLSGPRLEMFARHRRSGWVSWGRDVGFNLGPDGAVAVDEGQMPPAGPLFAGGRA